MLSLGGNISSTQVVESKYSASFDGIDDHVEFSDVGAVKSMSMWFSPDSNITSSSDPKRLVGFSTSYFGVSLGASTGSLTGETLCVLPDGSSRTATSRNFTAGEWYHLVISWNASNNYFDIYVNGLAETDLVSGTHSLANWTDFKIGAAASGNNFAGKITEVALWSVTLDSSNVVALYNNDKPINATINQGNYNNSSNLIGYWKTGNGFFDDKANGVVHDQDNPGFGSDLITNGDFPNGFTGISNSNATIVDGAAKIDNTGLGGANAYIIFPSSGTIGVVGDVYKLMYDVIATNGQTLTIEGTPNNNLDTDTVGRDKVKYFRFSKSSGTLVIKRLNSGVDTNVTIDNIRFFKLNGKPSLTSGGVTFSSSTP